MKLCFPQREEIHRVAGLPIVAVDLGFAKKRRSCGLAWQSPSGDLVSDCLKFGQCIDKVAALLAENPASVLTVEAPLSGLFDSGGNPTPRMPFEKICREGKTHQRYWYVGAGAAVGLGAAFFFTGLSRLLPQNSVTVNVFEGFVSFKEKPTKHKEDACALLKGLGEPSSAKTHNVVVDEGEKTVNMLSLAGLASPLDPCPTVIEVDIREQQ